MYSLESEFAILLQKMGVLRPGESMWTGLRYGPITGYRLGEAPGGSSYDDDGGGGPAGEDPDNCPWWLCDNLDDDPNMDNGSNQGLGPAIIYRGQFHIRRIESSSSAEVWIDNNGDLYVYTSFGSLLKISAAPSDEEMIFGGPFETVTSDAGTFYLHANGGTYILDGTNGVYRQVLKESVFNYSGEYLIGDTEAPPTFENAANMWETVTLENGASFWLDMNGNLYQREENWYPIGWPNTGGGDDGAASASLDRSDLPNRGGHR